ncbi:MAG: glycosyltransferase [Clostridia bacterium]|nr:glycosyltransferase [Clostridia bacterium]
MDFLTPYECKNSDFFEDTSQNGDCVIELKISGSKIVKPIRFFRKLCLYLKREKYDAVYINTGSMIPMTVSVLAAYICGVKKRIVHSHNNGINNKKSKIEQALTRPFLTICPTKYAACSQMAADYVFPKKKAKKTIIVPNGVDISKYLYNEKSRKAIRMQYNLEDKFVIGHVGAFDYQKNQGFLLDYFKEAYQVDNSLRLVLVGEGEARKDIKIKAEKLGILNEVIFTGKSDDVQEWLSAFDMFVFPSVFEGFGIAAVEAQISGLPCVLSDQVPQEVKVSENVWYLPVDKGREEWVSVTLELTKKEERKVL